MHNYGPVLDRTVWSGPAFSGTGPDCGPRLQDRTVRSSIFETELQSGGAGPYGPVFLNGLQKRPRSGPDRTVASLVVDERTLYSTARSARRQMEYGSAVCVMIVLQS